MVRSSPSWSWNSRAGSGASVVEDLSFSTCVTVYDEQQHAVQSRICSQVKLPEVWEAKLTYNVQLTNIQAGLFIKQWRSGFVFANSWSNEAFSLALPTHLYFGIDHFYNNNLSSLNTLYICRWANNTNMLRLPSYMMYRVSFSCFIVTWYIQTYTGWHTFCFVLTISNVRQCLVTYAPM